jgi:hypothetical protein
MNFYLKLFLFHVIVFNAIEIHSCSGSELDEPQQTQNISAARAARIEKAWNEIIKTWEKAYEPPYKSCSSWVLTPKNAKISRAATTCFRTIATNSEHPLHATKAWEAIKILSNCNPPEPPHIFSWETKKVALEVCCYITMNPNHPLYANITYDVIRSLWLSTESNSTESYQQGKSTFLEGGDTLFTILCSIIENPDHPLYKAHAGEIIEELWGTEFLGVRIDYKKRELAKIGCRILVQNSSPNDITDWNVVYRLYGCSSSYAPISEDQKLLIPVLSAITENTNHPLHMKYGSEAKKMIREISTLLSGSTDTSCI